MKANEVLVHHRDGISVAVKNPPPTHPIPSSRLGCPFCVQFVRPTSTRSLSGAPPALQVRGRRRRVKYYYVLCNGSHCYTELSRLSEESVVALSSSFWEVADLAWSAALRRWRAGTAGGQWGAGFSVTSVTAVRTALGGVGRRCCRDERRGSAERA